MKVPNKLIGSAASLTQLKEEMEKRYFYSEIGLLQMTETHWKVMNAMGDKQIEGFHVVKKGKRYRFEMVGQE